MDPNPLQTRRKILILVSAIDVIFSGILLMIYFGFLPVDIAGWGIPRRTVGWIGGIWFVGALAVLVFQLTKTDSIE